MVRNPLGSRAGPGLGSYPGHMAWLVSYLFRAVRASPSPVAFAYSSAFSLSGAPWCAGILRTVISYSLSSSLVLTSMTAMSKRCPGPMASGPILSMAEIESAKAVYLWPLSYFWSSMRSAR